MDEKLINRAIACVAQTPGVEICRLATRIGAQLPQSQPLPAAKKLAEELEANGLVMHHDPPRDRVSPYRIYVYPAGHKFRPLFEPAKDRADQAVRVYRPGDPDYPDVQFEPFDPNQQKESPKAASDSLLEKILEVIEAAEEAAIAQGTLMPSKAEVCRRAGVAENYLSKDATRSNRAAREAYEDGRDRVAIVYKTQKDSQMNSLADSIKKHCTPEEAPKPTEKLNQVLATIEECKQKALEQGRGMPGKTEICRLAGVKDNFFAPSFSSHQPARDAYDKACQDVLEASQFQPAESDSEPATPEPPVAIVVQLEDRVHQLEQENARLKKALNTAVSEKDKDTELLGYLDVEIQADEARLQEIRDHMAELNRRIKHLEQEFAALSTQEAEVMTSQRRLIGIRDRASQQSNLVNLRSA